MSSLRKIKEFYDRGGQVIATTRLPDKSAEFGKDAEVRTMVAAIFGEGEPHRNSQGGRAWFLPSPSTRPLRQRSTRRCLKRT